MNVFVYGTLLVPRIWEAVTRVSEVLSHPALLHGHTLRRVRGASYPGMFATPESVPAVPGRVYFDLPERVLRRLDAYEDTFYLRREVFPEVSGRGPVAAQAYLIPEDEAALLLSEESWSLEWFEENALAEFWRSVFEPHSDRPAASSRQSPSST